MTYVRKLCSNAGVVTEPFLKKGLSNGRKKIQKRVLFLVKDKTTKTPRCKIYTFNINVNRNQ
jgi:hypothetical protein